MNKNKIFTFGPFRLDTAKRHLTRSRQTVHLDRKPFDVLCFLVENRADPVTKEELEKEFWKPEKEGDYRDPSNVPKAIGAIRSALGDTDKKNRKYIKTLPEGRYRFVAEVIEEDDLNDAAILNQVNVAGKTPLPLEMLQETSFFEGVPQKVEPASSKMSPQNVIPPELESDIEMIPTNNPNGILIPFQEWLHGPGKKIKWLLSGFVILLIAVSIALLAWEMKKVPDPGQKGKPLVTMSFVSIAQLLLICFILFKYPPRPMKFRPIKTEEDKEANKKVGETFEYKEPDEWNSAKKMTEELQERYEQCWWGVLGTWILLYGLLLSRYLFIPDNYDNSGTDIHKDNWWLMVFINLVNNLNTMLLYLCYIILHREERDNSITSWIIGKAIKGASVIITICFVELLSIWILRNSDAPNLKNLPLDIATLGSALIGCVVMALYVGRLQSKFLDPPSWLIFALYSYTAAQSFFWYLADPKTDETLRLIGHVVLIDTYLSLKCLLYLYVTWLFQSGALLYYLARVGHTYHKLIDERVVFRKILKDEVK